ncbi:MAG: sigma-70 family RNA polymerase sigma factor [Planctomycetota bacterium]
MSRYINDDIEAYLKEISRFPLLKSDEEKDLARKIAKGDKEARDRMISSNLRLVVNIAKSYVNYGLPLMDLIAEGNIGLMKATERFNPEEGTSFSTYSSWWIKQSMRRAVNTKLKNVRVPAYMADIVSKWRKVSNRLSQDLERSATPDEVANEMMLKPEKIAIIQQAMGADSSSNFGRGAFKGYKNDNDEYTELINEIPAKSTKSSSPDTLFDEEEQKKMELLLSCLQPREQKVLRLRYGFDSKGNFLTLQAIGKKLKLTRERVRQIEGAALGKVLKIIDDDAGKI